MLARSLARSLIVFALSVSGISCRCDKSAPGDPPASAELLLNLQILNLSDGPANGATRVMGWVKRLDVVITPDSNPGQSEVLTLTEGPLLIDFVDLDMGRPAFAGTYPIPPGELHEVRFVMDNNVGMGMEVFYGAGPHDVHLSSSESVGFQLLPDDGQSWDINPGDQLSLLGQIDASSSADIIQDDCQGVVGCRDLLIDPPIPTVINPIPTESGYYADYIYVRYLPGTTESYKLSLEASLNGQLVFEKPSGLRLLKLPTPDWIKLVYAINDLLWDPSVQTAYPKPILKPTFSPNDELYDDRGKQYYMEYIRADDAWDVTKGSRTVVVAIVDAGIDINHRDLVNNLWVNEGELPAGMVDDFDFDSDGVFTLHDMNVALDSAGETARAAALADLLSSEGINFVPDAVGDSTLYEGGDLIAAFADGSDDDDNCVTDDLLGANFINYICPEDPSDPGPTGDIEPTDPTASDGTGEHGTAAAGFVGAEGNNDQDMAGVAFEVRIMEVVWYDSLNGSGDLESVLAGVQYAAEMGADVIVIENATEFPERVVAPDELCIKDEDYKADIIADYEAELLAASDPDEDGLLPLLVGATNQTEPGLTPADLDDYLGWPGSLELSNLITVGGTDDDTSVYEQGHYGSNSVQIAAPAISMSRGECLYTLTYIDGTGSSTWGEYCGTSQSVAIVGGAAALLYAEDSSLTASEARSALENGAATKSFLSGYVEEQRFLDIRGALDEL
jgi:subtilisin family serine protease